MGFVHLHLHTELSLLDGMIRPDELVPLSLEMGFPAVAITDHGHVAAAAGFHDLARRSGLKPIIGSEISVVPGTRSERKRGESPRHLLLLARDGEGYRNLCRLVSRSYLQGHYGKPRVDKELLRRHSKGLIGLSACSKGEIPNLILNGQSQHAAEATVELRTLFEPDCFYLELQRNGLPEQERLNEELLNLSELLHVPVVATNNCHYLNLEDHEAHDVLLCIQMRKRLEHFQRIHSPTGQLHLRSPAEMYKQFRGLEAALENTVEIASRCNVELRPERDLHPRIPIPTGETSDSYLRRLAEEGLSARLEQLRRSGGNPDDEGYRKRLDHELEVLSGARCSDYYLVVWDLLRHSRQCGIPVGPGRGSSAGSLLAYALGITQPDPMRFGLLFERFYNSDLAGLPDFDLDLGHRRRDELIDYLGSLHGDSGVSRTMTYNCPSALQTLRDVGAVLGFTPRETAEFSRLVPRRGKGMGLGMEELLVEVSARREVRADSARNRQLFEMASLLDGRRLKATVSPASVVISDKPLLDVTPLCVGPGKQVASQFTKPQMESRGFLVLDLLGSRTLTFIDDILALIRRNRKNPPDLEMLPLDCPEVYELLSSGETRGVFSMESPDMRKFLRRLRPDRFQDIMAAVALCRPGPIGCGMTRSYVDRKRGEEPVDCRHQSLEPLLQDTYGLLVYQEQLMGLAALVAGFSMAKADRLRRGIMARPGSGMPELEGAFFLGGVKRGHSEPFLADLLDHMKQCGRYAYNKAHAASYGLLTYWTAFLRAGFPEEFAAVRRPR